MGALTGMDVPREVDFALVLALIVLLLSAWACRRCLRRRRRSKADGVALNKTGAADSASPAWVGTELAGKKVKAKVEVEVAVGPAVPSARESVAHHLISTR